MGTEALTEARTSAETPPTPLPTPCPRCGKATGTLQPVRSYSRVGCESCGFQTLPYDTARDAAKAWARMSEVRNG